LNWGTFITLGGVAATIHAATKWPFTEPTQNALVLIDGLALGAISWNIIGPAFPQFLALNAQLGTTLASIMSAHYLMKEKALTVAWMKDNYKTTTAILTLISAALGDWEKPFEKLWAYLPNNIKTWFSPSTDEKKQ
jgi:hypothetical protein